MTTNQKFSIGYPGSVRFVQEKYKGKVVTKVVWEGNRDSLERKSTFMIVDKVLYCLIWGYQNRCHW